MTVFAMYNLVQGRGPRSASLPLNVIFASDYGCARASSGRPSWNGATNSCNRSVKGQFGCAGGTGHTLPRPWRKRGPSAPTRETSTSSGNMQKHLNQLGFIRPQPTDGISSILRTHPLGRSKPGTWMRSGGAPRYHMLLSWESLTRNDLDRRVDWHHRRPWTNTAMS